MIATTTPPKPFAALAAFLFSLFSVPALADHPAKGEKVWKKCRSCHEVGLDAKNRVGPHLNDLIGRPAGSVEGYSYSRAMRAAGEDGLVWTEETLDTFLRRPRDFVKKTKMSFSGLKKDEDRAAVIAYLAHFTTAANAANENEHLRETDPPAPPELLAIEGDPAYGQYLSGTCVGCHKPGGEGDGIPSITGWPTDVFVTVLNAYRIKSRKNPVMQQIAGSLSNEEIAALAAYFEQQP